MTDATADRARRARLAQQRSAAIDRAYEAYDRQPIDEPDAWGDLGAFREDAAGS